MIKNLYIRNIAKYYIFKQIVNQLENTPLKLKIVDMGCSNGKQWDWLYKSSLKNRIDFYGFDIDTKNINIAKSIYPQWNFFNEPAYNMSKILSDVDIIVSLSTLEHVYKRKNFLQSAYKILRKDNGIFYLNYDNGHFIKPNFKERMKTILGQYLAMLGYENKYQKLVTEKEINDLITTLKFVKNKEFYFQSATNKKFSNLFKNSNDILKTEFMEKWLEYELFMNNLINKDPNIIKEYNIEKYQISKVFVLNK